MHLSRLDNLIIPLLLYTFNLTIADVQAHTTLFMYNVTHIH